MKFLIVAGHEGTTGAVAGKLVEEALTKTLADKVVKHLTDQGHQAEEAAFNLFTYLEKYGVTPYLLGFDYILEIHFNATLGGSGTEIFVAVGETRISVEKAVMQRLKKWFRLRDDKSPADGVKENVPGYYILKALAGKQEASLLEVAFIDNPAEMAIFLANQDDIAKDIAYGLLEGFEESIKVVEPPKPSGVTMAPAGKLYRVGLGAFAVRENAEKVLADAKAKGFNAYLTLIDDPRRK